MQRNPRFRNEAFKEVRHERRWKPNSSGVTCRHRCEGPSTAVNDCLGESLIHWDRRIKHSGNPGPVTQRITECSSENQGAVFN
jgi:hypothetical protein